MTCDRCGSPIVSEEGSVGTGYGTTPAGERHCYACCADDDRASMVATGRATLYLTSRDGENVITNWPGSLTFKAGAHWTGRHNMWAASKVTFVRFIGPDGAVWAGRQIGDFNDILHCRRTKLRSVFA